MLNSVDGFTGEVLEPGRGTVHFVGRAHPLKTDIADLTMPAGLSIAEMIDVAITDQFARCYVNVYIDGELIAPEWHARLRPKAGTRVEFRAWVRGDDILRSVLMIAVLLTASWAGGVALAAGTSLFGLSATATAGLITAGINIAGMLIVNALVPPATQGQDALGSAARQVSLPGIRGSRNRAAPYEPIPLVLGRHLVVPLLGAEHYTENHGDDQYLRSLFVVGYGPLSIPRSDIRIGDTPINDYEDFEIEIREGYGSDAPIKLYPSQVFQEDLSLAVKSGWQERTTAPDVDEALVDTVAPQGIGILSKSSGEWETHIVRLQVMWRKVGGPAWRDGGEIVYEERKPRTRRRSRRITFPTRDQYEVRVRRVTSGLADNDLEPWVSGAHYDYGDQVTYIDRAYEAKIGHSASSAQPSGAPMFWQDLGPYDVEAGTADDDVGQKLDDVIWSQLRSIRTEHPIQTAVPLALIALRIKASDQLNGVIDDLSCIATSVVDDWNGASWVRRETRNPASLYRHLLRGPHLKRSIPASRLDQYALQQWHDACERDKRKCDAVIQGQRTLFDALKDVAATGRAAFMMKDGLYSIKRDVEQDVPVQMITQRNIISLSAERVFPDVPDAIRVSFVSAAAGYQPDEIVVYADGMNRGSAQTYDALDLWGVTDADSAFRDARYNMAVVKLRPERLTVRMDMEHLVARPGDMVKVAHDVMLVGLAQGRIVDRDMLAGACLSITVDEDCPMEAGKDYRVVVRRAGTANPELSKLVDTNEGDRRKLVFRTSVDSGEGIPDVGDLVAFGETGRVTEEWVVNGIEPDESLEATLTLVPHAPAVHTADKEPIPDYKPKITIPIEMRRPAPPKIIDVQAGDAALERMPNGNLRPRILVQVQIVEGFGEPPVMRLEAQARQSSRRRWDDDGVTVEGFSRVAVREVRADDRFDIRVRVISEFGRASRWVEVSSIHVVGASRPPPNITGLNLDISGKVATLFWNEPNELDVSHYLVRHSKATGGAQWATSVHVARVPAPATSVEVPLKVGTYLLKAVDNRGRTSPVASAISTSIARVRNLNFVLAMDADPGFAGTLDNTMVDGGLGGLRLVQTPAEEIIAETQAAVQVLVQAGAPLVVQAIPAAIEALGTWTSTAFIDLGAVFTARVSDDLVIGAVVLDDDVYSWGDVFAIEDVYGGVEDGISVRSYLSTTDDDPAGTPTWSEWRRLQIGDYTARAFRFRLELSSVMPGATPVVIDARFVVDMEDRVWSKKLTIAAGGTTVPFDPPFYVTPDVGLTIRAGAAGDRPSYTVDENGMTIQVLNTGGTGVSRVVEILARGYGERE